MKFKCGDKVRYVGNREDKYKEQTGVISHTKDLPQLEKDINLGKLYFPIGDFDYTVKFRIYSSLEVVLHAYENELEFV